MPTDRPMNRIVRADQAKAWIDGFAFLDQARSEAEELRRTVAAEIAEAREGGRREGRAEGEAEAAALLLRTEEAVDRYLLGLPDDIAALALQIVRRLVAPFDASELLARLALEAVATRREETGMVVAVAPEHAAHVSQALEQSGHSFVRVAADPVLVDGRCVLTTAGTSVQIGLEAQLEAIRSAMCGTLAP